MGVVETVMTEKEWKKHNKDWLDGFAAGTHREEIWEWFEETYGVSVGKDLMGL